MEGRASSVRSADVVVVGAGLSGLYAAKLMKDVAPDVSVVVVEASRHVGGRVKEQDGLCDWPVQLGPEFIHGKENSVLMTMIESWGWKTRELEWPDKYYFADTKETCSSENENEDIQKVHAFFDNILQEDEEEGMRNKNANRNRNRSVKDILRERGFSERQIEIAEVCYANDFGTSLSKMGLAELKEEKVSWKYGKSYLILDRPLSCLVEKLANGAGKILTNWQAKKIEYVASVSKGGNGGNVIASKGSKQCSVVNQNGQRIECDAIVLTVPLTILQDDDILFHPPLPPEKREAVSRVGMSTAIKVCLVFKHQFWPENFWDACCPFGFLPEIWATKYPNESSKSQGGCEQADKVAIIGFIAGERAEQMSKMTQEDIVVSSLSQLDEMFGSRIEEAPATLAFHSCHVKDWSQEPFIRGAYTYPSTAQRGDRGILAKSAGTLFFAGEATHEGVNPCMQGALETSERVVTELFQTFQFKAKTNWSKL